MQPYKLLATDLDGTLFDSHGRISRENFAAIHRLAEAGIPVVPATGRTLGDLPHELVAGDDIRYILHSNGAALYDKQTGERTVCGLSPSITRRVMRILRSFDGHLTVRTGGVSHMDAAISVEHAFARYHLSEAHADILSSCGKPVQDLASWAETQDAIEMLCMFFHDESEHAACRRLLEAEEDIRVVAAAPFNLEVVHRNAGKGSALHQLADRLGIDYEQTVCVGDSENDAPLLSAAGLALAVGNACPLLKRMCDEVICSNDEHAIAYIADRYFSVK